MAETSASKLSKRIHTDGSTHYKSATQPASVVAGDIWYDTSNKVVKVYNGTDFDQLSNIVFAPTGGTQTSYSGYEVATFTSSGTFTPNIDGEVDVLLIGGGGGGGAGRGGGGGGGGMVYRTGLAVTGGTAYTITVGAGGSGSTDNQEVNEATNGEDTVAFSVTAKGGGRGGSGVTGTTAQSEGDEGGSGGGTTHGADGPKASNQGTFSGWTSKGNAGGNGSGSNNEAAGGGGGAGVAGEGAYASGQGGNGGNGFQNDYQTGSNQYYGGGGGGGAGSGGTYTSGAGTSQSDPTAGSSNTGGGGGGGVYDTNNANFTTSWNQGANGGSGIVVIRWAV